MGQIEHSKCISLSQEKNLNSAEHQVKIMDKENMLLDQYMAMLEEHDPGSQKFLAYDDRLGVVRAEYAWEMKQRRPDPRTLIVLKQEINALERLKEHWSEELARINNELTVLKDAAGLRERQLQVVEQESQLCLMMEETRL